MKHGSFRTTGTVAVLLGGWTLITACARRADADARTDGPPVVASADGIPIAYETLGEGPIALVFVHGWSCDRQYWDAQLQPFAQNFQVVAVDLAGHGASGLGRDTQTMAAFGADVAAVADELGLQRMVLIGHSMGGDVIMEAARRLQGRVAGLVWVDTYRRLPTDRTEEQLEAFLAQFRSDFVGTTSAFVRTMFPAGADPLLVDRVATDMAAAPPAIALSALESALRYAHEIPAVRAELDLPIVAINADNQPTDVASMQRHGVDVVIMPGVGHFLMMEDPARFNEILRTVVDSLTRSRSNQ